MRPYVLKIGVGETATIKAVGNYVRIKTAGVSLLVRSPDRAEEAEMEQGDAVDFSPFERLEISHNSGVEQTVKVYVGKGTRLISAQMSGAVTISGPVEVANDSGNPLPVSLVGGSGGISISQGFTTGFQSSVLLGVNAVESVLAAAANTTGILLQAASSWAVYSSNIPGHGCVLMAKNGSTPASISDGVPITDVINGASNSELHARLLLPVVIPAGWALAWVNATGAQSRASRLARWLTL